MIPDHDDYAVTAPESITLGAVLPVYTAHLLIVSDPGSPAVGVRYEATVSGPAATVAKVIAFMCDAFEEDAER